VDDWIKWSCELLIFIIVLLLVIFCYLYAHLGILQLPDGSMQLVLFWKANVHILLIKGIQSHKTLNSNPAC